MNREQAAFLIAGLLFGVLIGVGTYHALRTTPDLTAVAEAETAPDPRGPRAPTQSAGPNAEGGAPMVAKVNELKRRLESDPQDRPVLLALANIYHDAAMWEPAAGYYERALELKVEPDVLTDLGVCYRGLRQYERALELFGQASALDPGHWQPLYNSAVVAGLDLGRFDEAVRALDAIAAIRPVPAGLESARLEQLRTALEHARSAAQPPAP